MPKSGVENKSSKTTKFHEISEDLGTLIGKPIANFMRISVESKSSWKSSKVDFGVQRWTLGGFWWIVARANSAVPENPS